MVPYTLATHLRGTRIKHVMNPLLDASSSLFFRNKDNNIHPYFAVDCLSWV